MSMLATVFIATDKEALEYSNLLAEGESENLQLESVDYSGLTPSNFQALFSVLVAGQRKAGDAFEHIAHEDSGEWWLEKFTPNFVAALAKMTQLEVEAFAGSWQEQDDEGSLDDEASAHIIHDLCRLAGLLASNDKSMYLWGSV